MGENSKISWTNHTFNPWWGCQEVSPECDNCYARTLAQRYGYKEGGAHFPIWGKNKRRRFFGDKHWNEPAKWNRAAERAGVRQRVFCGSMCDVMEEVVNNAIASTREQVYSLIQRTPLLDWLLLTKRPQNFRRFLPEPWLEKPEPNVWGMTTVGCRKSLWRVEELRSTPFAVRGLSVEPLLEDLGRIDLTGIHWVIVGGESGAGARPFYQEWALSLAKQCKEARVAFWMKQYGSNPWFEYLNPNVTSFDDLIPTKITLKDRIKGGDLDEWHEDLRIQQLPAVRA